MASNTNILKNVQKEPWFLELNPNGRIPVIVDRSNGDFVGFETAAILCYLQQRYDTKGMFGFGYGTKEWSEMMQWIFFAHGGIGPMQGQLEHFHLSSKDIPYAKERYLDETKRLYGVLEKRLQDRDYLVGPGRGVYTLADITSVTWVRMHEFTGLKSIDEFPRIQVSL
jgi:glutathione S-transferase